MAKKYYHQIPVDRYLKYRRAMRFVRYWRKIERKFRLRRMIGKTKFALNFKHGASCDLVFDDEWMIEAIAKYYGYCIKDESLSIKKSRYTFVSM